MEKIAFYIHIPFCLSKCIYCNFNSMPCQNYDDYVGALCKEISLVGKKYGRRTLKTLYFGGGTPTLLSPFQFSLIVDTLQKHFDLSHLSEFSMECNPASADKEKIAHFISRGVNRFSVGLQCANDEVLKFLGRPHNVEDFLNTVDIIHQCGISNVGCDIILGLPNCNDDDLKRAVDIASQKDLTHISAYMLSVEKGTPLYSLKRQKKVIFPNDDQQARQYELVCQMLLRQNFYRYEVSNFSKKGYECQHNLSYWDYTPYLACGLSASGFINGKRYKNVASIDNYINKTNQNKLPLSSVERIDERGQIEEYVMLGLRTSHGIDLDDFNRRFGVSLTDAFGTNIDFLVKKGLLLFDGQRLTVTKPLLLNSIIVKLLYGL